MRRKLKLTTTHHFMQNVHFPVPKRTCSKNLYIPFGSHTDLLTKSIEALESADLARHQFLKVGS
jgi:hypothetical protein